MLSRVIALLPVAAVAAVAAVAPNGGGGSVCSTGSQYCCNQGFSSPVLFKGVIGELLNVLVDVDANAGLNCSPVTILGLGSGGTCTSQTACCKNVQTNGLTNVVCDPIVVNA